VSRQRHLQDIHEGRPAFIIVPVAQLWDRLTAALGESYRVERELGGGGMSRVFAAQELALDRHVVVKVLPPEMAIGVNAERFRREIQLAASLQHPHIVPLLAAGHHNDLVYYTMPLIEGESLRARLAREGELPIPEAIRILRDVADALAYAHSHGVVHRDIKPDNVLLTGQHAVVTDFGVAKALSESTGSTSLTSIGVALGTPAYMSPEQAAADRHVDHRADIYALGALAYELLTGRPPFVGANPQQVLAAHVTQAPDPVGRHRAAVPPALAALVMRCLEKRAADRWQWAAEVHAQLDALATPSGGTAPTGAAPSVLRRRWLRVAAAVGLVVVAGGGYALWRGRERLALDPNVVAVMPFRVAGADPGLHYLREGMLDMLAALLTGEGGPRAADTRTLMSAWRRAGGDSTTDVAQDAAIGVARQIGAGHALFGAAVGSQGHLSLSATLVRTSDSAPEARATADGPADSLPALVSRLASQLLVRGAHLGQSEASLTTTSLEALRAYLAGRAAYRIGSYPEAARQLEYAIDQDSTFALAAFQLLLTGGWTTIRDPERARRLAFAGRGRLSPHDSMLVEAYIGARYPERSAEPELLAAREQLIRTVSDDPDAWYILGDKYFHMGGYVGHQDWAERSRAALSRAVALDSTFAGPIQHLIELALEAGDTSEVRRLLPLLRENQSEGALARFVSTLPLVVAYTLHDSTRIRDAWARLDTARVRPLVTVAQYYGLEPAVLDRLLALERRAISNEGERRDFWSSRAIMRFNQGGVRDAVAAVDSIVGAASSTAAFVRLMAALYWEGDSAAGSRAAPAIAAALESPPRNEPEFPGVAHRMACYLAEWRAIHGDFLGAARITERMRHIEPTDLPWVRRFGAACPAIVDAMTATLQRRSDARRLAERADSIMLLGPNLPPPNFENLTLSRVFAALGDPRRALAVIRRRTPGGVPAPYISEEARLAAQVGDRDGAIRAYQRYLALRYQPDSAIQMEVNQMRAELAKLVGETGTR
jgi:eukaryotic-like serine/threonine-protein kinase